MEMAFFRVGMTKTASDQSMSIGAASGSFATALAISSSVSASTRAQSVLPFLGESLETIVIFSSLVSVRAPCRDRNFPPFDVPEDLIPDFAITIRSADEGVAVENAAHVLEVDSMISQVGFTFLRIPSEVANTCEQPLHLFRHGEIVPEARGPTRLYRFAMNDSKRYALSLALWIGRPRLSSLGGGFENKISTSTAT